MELKSTVVRVRPWLHDSWSTKAIFLVIAVVVLGSYYRVRSLTNLSQNWLSAQTEKNVVGLEALYCWEGVSPAERQRMRLLIAQELEYPVVRTAWVDLGEEKPNPGWRPNCTPVRGLRVEYRTDERFTVTYQIGRSGLFRYQFVVMVPEK